MILVILCFTLGLHINVVLVVLIYFALTACVAIIPPGGVLPSTRPERALQVQTRTALCTFSIQVMFQTSKVHKMR